jgi:hypothetical protein
LASLGVGLRRVTANIIATTVAAAPHTTSTTVSHERRFFEAIASAFMEMKEEEDMTS